MHNKYNLHIIPSLHATMTKKQRSPSSLHF